MDGVRSREGQHAGTNAIADRLSSNETPATVAREETRTRDGADRHDRPNDAERITSSETMIGEPVVLGCGNRLHHHRYKRQAAESREPRFTSHISLPPLSERQRGRVDTSQR